MRRTALALLPIAMLAAAVSTISCRGMLGVEDAVLESEQGDSGTPQDSGPDGQEDVSNPSDAQPDSVVQDVSTEQPFDGATDAPPAVSELKCQFVMPEHLKLHEAMGPAFFLDSVHADAVTSQNVMKVVYEQEGTTQTTQYVYTAGPGIQPDAAAFAGSQLNWLFQYSRLHGAITTEDPPGNMVVLTSWFEDKPEPETDYHRFFPVRVPAGFPSVDNSIDKPIELISSYPAEVTGAKLAHDGSTLHFAANYTIDQLHHAWTPPYITLASSSVASEVALTELVRIGSDNYIFLAGGAKGPELYVVNDLDSPPIDPHYFASAGVELLAASASAGGDMNIALRDTLQNVIYLGRLNTASVKKLQLGFLTPVPISSLSSSPLPTAKVTWIGDDLVMIGPSTDPNGLSFLWLDLLGRVRAQGKLGSGAGGQVWKVLAARQSWKPDVAEVHVTWTERTELDGSPLRDIGWYNQIRCEHVAP